MTTNEAASDLRLEILDQFTRPPFVSAFEVFIPNLLEMVFFQGTQI